MKNIQESFIALIKTQELYCGFKQAFEINNQSLLLIQQNNKIYLIKNKCGHFGVKLDNADVKEQDNITSICCKEHGICFSLSTGKVTNRPWENCDPIQTIDIIFEGDMLGFKSTAII